MNEASILILGRVVERCDWTNLNDSALQVSFIGRVHMHVI